MIFPAEIWRLIFANLSPHSLTQCARASKHLNIFATYSLYTSPVLPTAQQFHTFAERLTTKNAALIEVLDFSNTASRWSLVYQKQLIEIIPKCCSIRHLDLDICTDLRDDGLEIILKTIGSNLKFLSLCSCNRIMDAGINSIANYCTNLRVLNLSGTNGCDDVFLLVTARNPNLESVNIAYCPHITEVGVRVEESDVAMPGPEWETESEDEDI
ncbi:hypothetical protein INT43_002443 [Umbelopsis isabellina]|uniref:F-box domain-containing protein n=1 Tax=Mortierella isabellina TaxID=91625 RepID=A0A8H7UK11_MORIS|nr:hypothetical protein INT43_002443 [Umbelopsis isabellina]